MPTPYSVSQAAQNRRRAKPPYEKNGNKTAARNIALFSFLVCQHLLVTANLICPKRVDAASSKVEYSSANYGRSYRVEDVWSVWYGAAKTGEKIRVKGGSRTLQKIELLSTYPQMRARANVL